MVVNLYDLVDYFCDLVDYISDLVDYLSEYHWVIMLHRYVSLLFLLIIYLSFPWIVRYVVTDM